MSRLQKYAYHINSLKKQTRTIWNQSPCTLSFTNKLPPLDKADRFHYNSIYYRDDPFKPARKIDQFQKPELLLMEFRRSIKEAEKIRIIKKRSSSKRNQDQKQENSAQKFDKQKQIVDRLCPKNPKKLKLQYDLYGNRSSFYATQSQSSKNRSKKSLQYLKRNDTLFTESQRIDMSRPQNFNPGPGTYFNNRSNKYLLKSKQGQNKSVKKVQKSIESEKSQTINVSRNSQLKQRIIENSATIQ